MHSNGVEGLPAMTRPQGILAGVADTGRHTAGEG